jgi:nucleoside-diphosphate-sugar epimerase
MARARSHKGAPPRAASGDRVFLTGFPGFIAKRLLRRLLADNDATTAICLVEDGRRADADAEVARLAPPERRRVRLVFGDVRKMDLGLAGVELRELADTTHVFHLAGIQSTSADTALLRAVNVDGVRNVLALCRELPSLKRLLHVSSCFVSGDRQGVILEEHLDDVPAHRTAYEDSKFQGERLARAAMAELPISVVRPAIVVGDSHTGEVDRFDAGVYAMGILVVTSPVSVPIPLPGPGLAPLHVIPVDYLTRVIARIAATDDAVGKTFHVVDPNPLSARMIYDLVARRAGKRAGPPSPPTSRWASSMAASLAMQRVSSLVGPLLEAVPGFERIRRGASAVELFDRFVLYNASNTAQLLVGTDIICPRFDTYVDALVNYVKNALREERLARSRSGVQDSLLES